MEIFYTISEIKNFISTKKLQKATIGFVPTMGALHKGHLSLLEKAKKENTICVCSIFVNPNQFNNKDDFAKYPRNIDEDIVELKSAGCDVLFAPLEKEMYPYPDKTIYDLGGLDKLMEGAFRPGHFNGVAVIVKKLFDIILPDKVYFGEKDFQQLAIIKFLIKQFNLPLEIVSCPTVREYDGLAMSSRNTRLSFEERKIAPVIYQTLLVAKEMAKKHNIEEIKSWVEKEINNYSLMKLEYFEIVNQETLETTRNPADKNNIACIAVCFKNARLIDNIKFL